jgi:eukaryotic-like serine/threonine-protein kinase
VTEQAASNTAAPASKTVLGGRYELREPVGEGGMAVVWRAFDSVLKRDVALKILHDYVPPTDRQRFRREIRTLARLAHPNIIGIFDLGEDDGRAFFTMELLSGGAIQDLGALEDSADELEGFLRVAVEAARGLQYVHRQNLVHRDLTPRNILLDASRHPRIMDFGLVYVSDATRDLTRTGYTLGTPQYMAPEQARGGIVNALSDVYSFGAVLYRTATGRAPFEADNDQGILYQHVYEPPKPLEAINPALPRILGETLLPFLEKRPEDRPQDTVETLEEGLERLRIAHFPAQYRGGRARTGVHPGGATRPERLKLAWEVSLGGEITWGSALTGNGEVIAIGTRAGALCLLDARVGAKVAQFPAGDEITAPASFDGDTLVYAGWDGVVRAVNWRSGAQHWSFRARADVVAAPTPWNDLWLVASRDAQVYAVKNGRLEWLHRASSAIAATPTIWGGQGIVADEDGQLCGVNLLNGKRIWNLKLDSVHVTPGVQRDPQNAARATLVVPSWSGEVNALTLQRSDNGWMPDAEPAWSYDLEGEVWASPVLCGKTTVLGSWTKEGTGSLRAVTLADGDDLWNVKLEGRVTGSPIVSRGVVYAASELGELVAVRLSDGKVLWRDHLDSSVQATMLVMNGALYVATMDGRVRCYR